MRMKILILGNRNSFWLAQFFENCIRPQDEVVLFSEKATTAIFDVFLQNNIKIVDLERKDINMSLLRKCNNIFLLRKYKKELNKLGPFDLVNVQFVDRFNSILAALLKGKNTKLVYSFWGSDLLRANKLLLFSKGIWIKKGDCVTFDNIDLQDKFNEVYGKSYKGKKECAYFGIQTLDDIEIIQKEYSKQQIKEELIIPQDKICIAVGYNGIKEQQHHKVIAAINKLPEEYKNRIYLLVMMTYGGTAEYHDSVIDALKNIGVSYKVFQKFLPSNEVAKIRLVTDIFINAQTTDAFAGSVCENLYCGNILINAAWLQYKELNQYNIQYVSFLDFEQLTQVMKECLDGGTQIDTTGNKDKIASLRLWSKCTKRWNRILYEKNSSY